jgi:hypothetical protein
MQKCEGQVGERIRGTASKREWRSKASRSVNLQPEKSKEGNVSARGMRREKGEGGNASLKKVKEKKRARRRMQEIALREEEERDKKIKSERRRASVRET